MLKKILPINQERAIKSLLTICFLTTILFLFIFFNFANYGFDFTDEGYYLNSLEDNNRTQISYFAELIRPIYLILNKNIVHLRQLNIFFSLLLGYLSLEITFRKSRIISNLTNNDVLKKHFIIFLLSTSSLTGLTFLTPNYNSLCFFGLNFVYISFINLFGNYKKNFFYPFFLILGLSFLLFAKFTTAAVIIFAVLIISFFEKKSFVITCVSILFSFILFISWLTLTNNIDFSELILEAKYNYSKLKILNSHSIYDSLRYSYYYILDFLSNIKILCFWVSLNILLFFSENLKFKWKDLNINLSFLIFPIYLLIIIYNLNAVLEPPITVNQYCFGRIFYLAFPFSCLIIRIVYLGSILNRNFLLFLITLAFPYFYILGSNTSYYYNSLDVPIFFYLSGLILLSDLNKIKKLFIYKKVFNFLFFTTFLSSIIFFNSVLLFNKYPPRQLGSLFDYSKEIVINENSLIKISDKDFNYITTAKQQIYKNGFKNGQLIIDMTGRSPGLIYALNGKSFLAPWIIGGYPNSNKLLEFLLSKEDCKDLKSAWILTEPNGPRSLNIKYLLQHGIDINDPDTYKKVVELKLKGEKFADDRLKTFKQYLYKPLRIENILHEC